MTTRLPAALDDITALALLLDVVEGGSFSRAAKRRGLTTSAVSKRVAELERRLGVSLVARTTRRLSPTDAGRRLLARAERVLGELHDAERELSDLSSGPSGVLRVATSVSLGQAHVGRMAVDFGARHPQAQIELSVDEQLVDLVAGAFDLAVRCGTIHGSTHTLTTKKIAPSKRVLCAAPSYLAQRGAPRTIEGLTQHECLRHVLDGSGRTWTFAREGKTFEVEVRGRFYADNSFVLLDAAIAGAGIAFLPTFVIADHVKTGRLRVVLEDFTAEKGWVYLAFPSPRPSKLARAFADFVSEQMKSALT